MESTLRGNRVGSGMVLLLTAHQLPFQSTDETTATAANAKADTQ